MTPSDRGGTFCYTNPRETTDPKSPISAGDVVAARRGLGEQAWAIVNMRADERLVIDEALIAALQAASSPHTIRALKSDLEAFDLWCRKTHRIALPATPAVVADYLDARAGEGSKPASLVRYKASIARVHKLLGIGDPTSGPWSRFGSPRSARRRASPRSSHVRCASRARCAMSRAMRRGGLNIRALLDGCPDDLPGLRDRALLSTAYDTGLRASELCAMAVEHITAAIDPEARLLQIPKHKGD